MDKSLSNQTILVNGKLAHWNERSIAEQAESGKGRGMNGRGMIPVN